MVQEYQKMVVKNIFITKWVNEVERYVKYDHNKKAYLRVNLDDAQQFDTREEADRFANMVNDAGFEKPEIVCVEVKPMA